MRRGLGESFPWGNPSSTSNCWKINRYATNRGKILPKGEFPKGDISMGKGFSLNFLSFETVARRIG